MPAGFQCEDVVDVDCDVQVTEDLLREEEITEEIRGVLDEENENDDVEVAERSEDIPIKPNSQQGRIQEAGTIAPQAAMFPIANNSVKKLFT